MAGAPSGRGFLGSARRASTWCPVKLEVNQRRGPCACISDGRFVPRRRRLCSSWLSGLSLRTLDCSSREDLHAFLPVYSPKGRPVLQRWTVDSANPRRSLAHSLSPFLTRHYISLTSLSNIIATKYRMLLRGPSRGSPRACDSVIPLCLSSPGTPLRRQGPRGCHQSAARYILSASWRWSRDRCPSQLFSGSWGGMCRPAFRQTDSESYAQTSLRHMCRPAMR